MIQVVFYVLGIIMKMRNQNVFNKGKKVAAACNMRCLGKEFCNGTSMPEMDFKISIKDICCFKMYFVLVGQQKLTAI